MSFPLRHRPSLAALGLAVVLAACGTTTAPTPVPTATPGPSTPAPSGSASPVPSPSDDASIYAAIEEQVRAIRELDAKATVDPKVIGEPELVDIVKADFTKHNPADYVDAYGRLLKHLGLMRADDDLGDLFIELLGSQVIGLYNPEDKQLYVVSRKGGLGPTQKLTFAHEYTHALQDQHFDSQKLRDVPLDQGDRSLAHIAVDEGDATLLMAIWMQGNLTPSEIATVAAEASSPEQQAIMSKMPRLLQETLQFPYGAGLNFVGAQHLSGGWAAVDALFAKPPETTEQVLHPDKYTAGEAAIPVSFPKELASGLGAGWTETLQDTLGEFQMAIWLIDTGGAAMAAAGDAAAGWGGDRVALLEGPDGAWAVVVETAWDTKEDQAAFIQASQGLVAKLTTTSSFADVLNRDETTATVLIGNSRGTLGKVANVLGLAG